MALHYAHERRGPDGQPLSIVHRDVSPSNLFVTYEGAVKVLDFGIARASQRIQQTQAGYVKGKAAYISPEQARGKPVDRRADVWSLGVCLHEVISGQRLFTRERASDTILAVLEAPIPPLSSLRPEVPPDLEAVAMRALERERENRYPTADAMRSALDRFLADRTYVPQSVQLGRFLKGLFGEERAESRADLAIARKAVPATSELPAGAARERSTLSLPSAQETATLAARPSSEEPGAEKAPSALPLGAHRAPVGGLAPAARGRCTSRSNPARRWW
ncbi:MAG: serine/threonine protein kinase [Myxococcales bacterium]|nr:serine/threonine protein kinase [Myxococcales bacterium]